jgi:hypothetical protein
LAGFDQPSLENGDKSIAVFQDGDIPEYISIDDQNIRKFSDLQGAELIGSAHDFRAGSGRAADRFHG